MFGWITGFFKALNANSNPAEIAHALSLGVLLGFMPKTNALWYIIFIFFMFVRINKGTYTISLLIVSLFSWRLDPLFNSIGFSVLTFSPLENVFAMLIDIPFVGFTKFNNTVVMGSLVFGLLLYLPVFFLGILFVRLWRKHIASFIIKTPVYKAVAKIPALGKLFDILRERL